MKRRSWLALVVVLLALWANGVTASYAAKFAADDETAQFGDDALPCVIVVHEPPVRVHVIVDTHVPVQRAIVERPIIKLAPKTSPPR